VSYRVEALRARIEDVKARHAPSRMDNTTFTRRDGTAIHADIWITPLAEGARQLGVLVFAIEATEHARLREQMSRVAEQHATAIEELQSTNEELETTNEELQSTNEELETTNEELQSTNEELETTVEELQAANTELGALNAELETRSADLNRLDRHHRAVLESFEPGVVITDPAGVVKSWNAAAERLWLLPAARARERDLLSLPLPGGAELVRAAFQRVARDGAVRAAVEVPCAGPNGQAGVATLTLTPVRDQDGAVEAVLAMLVPRATPSAPGSQGVERAR
jgi:two-component system CheB/CheR fusion protein